VIRGSCLLRRYLLAAPLCALAALACTSAPAFAFNTHVFSTSFASSGSGDGQVSLASNSGVAVNGTSHDVYVADTGNHRVDQFSSSGTFIRAFGADVGGPGVNTCTSGCVAGTPGSGPGAFTTPALIAIDNSPTSASQGDVYVADAGDNLVSKFDASGNLIATWGTGGQLDGSTATNGPFGSPVGVAVDVSGGLWVFTAAPFFTGEMFEFAQDSSFVTDWNSQQGNPLGIAVDSATDLYIPTERGVTKFTSAGSQIGVINGSPFEVFAGLALDGASDDLYVDDGGTGQIDHYAPSCDPSVNPCAPADSFGSGHLKSSAGLAVDSSSHTVYAADTGNARISVFAQITLPDVTAGAASNIQATAATLQGTVNPAGLPVTDCHFSYVDDAHYDPTSPDPYSAGATAPCAETVGSGSSDVPVHADITGLQAGTTYHFRLQASNAEGANFGQDATFPTLPVPVIESTSASNLTQGSAQLNAKINPEGLDTTYHFEWGPTTAYGHSVPIPDEDIGAGASRVIVKPQQITGLAANETYHWRVVATNANGTSVPVDHTFVYETSGAALPDGRAYEMVTPPFKNGAVIGSGVFIVEPDISEDGSRMVIASIQCFEGATSCTADRQNEGEPYAFTRTAAGWVTTALAPPPTQTNGNTLWQTSADAGTALYTIPTAPEGEDDFYTRQHDGSLLDIGPVYPPGDGEQGVGASATRTTADLSHVVYLGGGKSTKTQGLSLAWPFDQSVLQSTYEYVGTGNPQPILVGVSGGPGSTDLLSACGTSLGGGGKSYNTISADGRTVYFTALGQDFGEECVGTASPPTDELFARVDESQTVPLSQRSPSHCTTSACQSSAAADARFEGASTDGSRAFFSSTQQLTDSASEDASSDSARSGCSRIPAGETGCNLYEYDFALPAAQRLVDVSAGDTSGHGPRVQGVVAASSDGSHVYFVARGVLGAGANVQGQTAHDGAENLYVFERDAGHPGGHIAFVTVLTASDSENWEQGVGHANVTPDGRFLVFTSHGALTPDDSRRDGARQVFRYDAQTGELVRVSIGEHGFNDNGNAGSGDATIVLAENTFNRAGPARPDPTMSHDGAYVFFMSPVALAPHALDDVQVDAAGHLAQNVYEYHDGHVHLISDGRDVSADPPRACNQSGLGFVSSVCLVGTDATGANVFFTTADSLVPSDTDSGIDFYDARVCTTGDPCVPPAPPSPPPCLGEACHGTPAATPSLLTPGSASFNGAGNLTAPPAPAKARTAAQIRAEKLAKALRACRKIKSRNKRAACQRQARKRYGPVHNAKKTSKAGKASDGRRPK
jgi:hypothetical protein